MPTLALLAVSLIWGSTFVAVKGALDDAPPLMFLALRFSVAFAGSLLFLRPRPHLRSALAWGLPVGLVFGGAYAAQTIGLVTTTPARSGFLTGINVLLIPLWGAWLLRRPPGWIPLVGLLIAVVGLWFLADPGTGSWVLGDTLTLVCAVLFALHVVLLTRFGRSHDRAGLLSSQLAIIAVMGFGASAMFETRPVQWTSGLIGALVLTGLLATLATTALQLRFQPFVTPIRTALVFATEPLFAAAFSVALFGERLTLMGWLGGGLVLVGMIVSELGSMRKQRSGNDLGQDHP